ncbi:anti-sigma F factor antagonist, partial [Clostridium botulinum]|nr:anti-sigma F factor antagonist [Clostridium botulinum]
MYLKFDKKTDKLIVTMAGELDHHSAEEVRNVIDDR